MDTIISIIHFQMIIAMGHMPQLLILRSGSSILANFFGFAHDLKRTPEDLIKKGRLQMIQQKVENERKRLYWGRDLDSLPSYTKDEVVNMVKKEHAKLVMMDGMVYDVEEWMGSHPGGDKILVANLGRDIKSSFNGGVYLHSTAARNLVQTLRCGKLV